MRTVVLLLASNIFMTFAWYYHLQQKGWPLWKAIALSWGIAFFEYCLMVPANRYGFANGFSGYQLKMIQEVITLVVFCLFATFIVLRNNVANGRWFVAQLSLQRDLKLRWRIARYCP